MIIIIVLIFLLLVLAGVLLWSPVTIEADTRTPELQVKWKRIATVRLTYEEGKGIIYIRAFFITRRWTLGAKPARKRPSGRRPPHRDNKRPMELLGKGLRVIRTFRVVRMEIALDTSDPATNGLLFPLNFFPYPAKPQPAVLKIHINFLGENYLLLCIKNTPWRMLTAWLGW